MSLSYPTSILSAGKTYYPFSGSFQELRYYDKVISESIFLDYVMNPYSIEGTVVGDEAFTNNLMFRAPLGSVLDISGSDRTSIHPSQTQYPVTQSTSIGSGYKLSGSYSFIPNKEVFYLDQFPNGIKNAISNKIKITDNILPSGDVISPYISIQQSFPISESYTRDVNYVEVAFSPQNEINDDIISQLGYFNIGEYIGDPRQLSNTTASFYPDFNKIRDDYFSKYQRNYNLTDFIRLIKYFDNSLFKLIKDFVPARTSLASGVVIKQHLLERNRYSPAQVDSTTHDYSASVLSYPFGYTGSHTIYKFSGGQGGVMPELSSSFTYPWFNQVTQSWSESFLGPKGLSYISHSTQDEFYDGIFKGATILASTQSLTDNPYLDNNYQSLDYQLVFWDNVYSNTSNESPYAGQNKSDFTELFLQSEPNLGQLFLYVESNNVNYIKINTYDSNSINRDQILNNLKELDIIYTNNTTGKYQLSLIGKSVSSSLYSVYQNPDYYLSDGFTTGSYNMSGSDSGSLTTAVAAVYRLNLNKLIYDPNNYLVNFSSPAVFSCYRINTGSSIPYVNTLIDFNISLSTSNTSSRFIVYVQEYIVSPQQFPYAFSYRYPANTTVFTGSFVAKKDSKYLFLFQTLTNDPATYFPYTINNFTASFTQRALPQSGSLPKLINVASTQDIVNFPLSEYNVIKGNLDGLENNQYYDSVELDGYYISDSYFNALLSSSGTPSTVKDYYYKLRRHIKPRYIGSRNTSDNFNTSSISQSFEIQTNQKISLDPSVKEGVAYNYDTTIYEYTGGSNLREMPNFSRVILNQIISTDNTSSVNAIKPNDDSFKFTIDSQLTNQSTLTFNQYSSEIGIPTNTKFFSSTINPEISAYIVPSDTSAYNAASKYAGTSLVFTHDNVNSSIATVKLDNNGNYVTGSMVFMYSMSLAISTSLAEGDRWFISTFSGSYLAPISEPGIPLGDEPILQNNWDILAKNNIYEITLSNPTTGGCALYSQKITSYFQNSSTYGGGRNGVLIWKMAKNSNAILFSNTNMNGLGAGNFITNKLQPDVKKNLNYIVETFGNKPQN